MILKYFTSAMNYLNEPIIPIAPTPAEIAKAKIQEINEKLIDEMIKANYHNKMREFHESSIKQLREYADKHAA